MNAPAPLQHVSWVEVPLDFRTSGRGKRSLVTCPKCDQPCFIRYSKQMTEKVKHLVAHCTNSGCGHTFKLELVFMYSLVPGNINRPDLDLPVCHAEDVTHVIAASPDAPASSSAAQSAASGQSAFFETPAPP